MNLTINSTFRPFTYDEMVKPLLAYKEAYDKTEEEYFKLLDDTEQWKDLVSQDGSPEAFALYNRYSTDLNSIVDDFSRGMRPGTRKALINMKRRYSQDIKPIENAVAAMKEANDLRAKASPDAIFEVSEYNSVDQFLHGKTANNRYQSREALLKKTAAVTEAAMNEALKDPEFKKAMNGQYWDVVQHTGGSYKDLQEAMKLGMMDNPIAQNRFSEIRQRIAKEVGVDKYDAMGQRAIMDTIDTGLFVGLDKPSRSFMQNVDHITPLQAMARAGSGGGGRRRGGSRGGGSRAVSGVNPSSALKNGAYVPNNAVFEFPVKDKDLASKKGIVKGNYNMSRPHMATDTNVNSPHGKPVTLGYLEKYYPEMYDFMLDSLDGADADQFEYYMWRNSSAYGDRESNLRLQRVQKQAPHKKGEGSIDALIDDIGAMWANSVGN